MPLMVELNVEYIGDGKFRFVEPKQDPVVSGLTPAEVAELNKRLATSVTIPEQYKNNKKEWYKIQYMSMLQFDGDDNKGYTLTKVFSKNGELESAPKITSEIDLLGAIQSAMANYNKENAKIIYVASEVVKSCPTEIQTFTQALKTLKTRLETEANLRDKERQVIESDIKKCETQIAEAKRDLDRARGVVGQTVEFVARGLENKLRHLRVEESKNVRGARNGGKLTAAAAATTQTASPVQPQSRPRTGTGGPSVAALRERFESMKSEKLIEPVQQTKPVVPPRPAVPARSVGQQPNDQTQHGGGAEAALKKLLELHKNAKFTPVTPEQLPSSFKGLPKQVTRQAVAPEIVKKRTVYTKETATNTRPFMPGDLLDAATKLEHNQKQFRPAENSGLGPLTKSASFRGKIEGRRARIDSDSDVESTGIEERIDLPDVNVTPSGRPDLKDRQQNAAKKFAGLKKPTEESPKSPRPGGGGRR